ncbi:MAG: hypothetical protein R6X18_18275 [Chloroflexota bacterium]
MLRPTLSGIKGMVQDAVQREVEMLLENYGTEYWDGRDVTYDNLIWGTSGIEVPIKRILFQVELVMQDAVAKFMPEAADIMADELQRTMEAHEMLSRLERAAYEQEYSYTLPGEVENAVPLAEAYRILVDRIGRNFRYICQQATMYELMRSDRSVHARLDVGERELALPTNERLLDVALYGPERVAREIAASMPQLAPADNSDAPPVVTEEPVEINILDTPVGEATPDFDISFLGEDKALVPAELETSYADLLDNVAVKVNRIFVAIIDDLFSDDDLLPRLRRLFWLEATKTERDFNNLLIKPMLRQHDRNLHKPELRKALEVDLESVSDMEELMRVWDGLHNLETSITI